MEDYVDLERDLENDEGLEEQIEREWEREENQQRFASEILFCVQGLGSEQSLKTDTGTLDTYVKGQHCEASLKDLCRFCRRDEPERPVARIFLANWRVLQKDLIKLLTCYPQDKVLTYYVVILLESLTNTAPLEFASKASEKDIIFESLQESKLCFLRPMVLETLMNHFADCVSLTLEQRSKVHNQMIELIVLIFRNLLQIPDYQEKHYFMGHFEIKKNLQRSLIEMFIKESVLAGLIYISQDFSETSVAKKLSISLVEIFYRIYTAFDQEWLLRDPVQDRNYYQKLLQQNHAQQHRISIKAPPRHSRFAGFFYKNRLMTKGDQPSKQVFSQPHAPPVCNYNPYQRHKPVLKSIPMKHKTIFVKKLDLQDDPQQERTMKEELCISAIDFMQHCFSRLVEAVEEEIAKESDRIEVKDKVHYFVLIAYFLKFTRLYCGRNIEKHVKQSNSELSSEFVYVAAALQLTQFELIYSNMLKESTQLKKRFFNYRNFFSVCNVMLEFLYIVRDLSLSTQSVDRKNAQILMQNIFQHDISKALRIGFTYCVYGLFDDELLKCIVQLTSLFFDMLESYSQGKTLAIKTSKMLKKKIKKNIKEKSKKQKKVDDQEEDEMAGFIEKDMFDEENNDNESPQQNDEGKDSDSDETDDDEPIYKERKFNLMSEFAIVVEYGVVAKIFYLLQGDKIFSNSTQLNTSIYKYCQRVIDLLNAEWLFFQLDFLSIINSILSRNEIIIRNDFRNLVTVFRRISRSFILFLNKNSLLGIEALFRFPDSHTKDQILTNYPDEVQENPLNNNNDNDQDNNVNMVSQQKYSQSGTLWSRQEDEALIENYERFRDCDNPEEQLSLYLGSIGFSVKSPFEVKKRIKKYRLAKSTMNEIKQKFNEVHEKLQLRKEEVLEDNIRELNQVFGEDTTKIFFEELITQLEEYIEFRQNEAYEIPIPPLSNIQFDFFDKQFTYEILICLDLKHPAQGEVYWRLQPHTTMQDLGGWRELIRKAMELACDPQRTSDRKRNNMQDILPTLVEDFIPKNKHSIEEEEEEHYVYKKQQIQEESDQEIKEQKESYKQKRRHLIQEQQEESNQQRSHQTQEQQEESCQQRSNQSLEQQKESNQQKSHKPQEQEESYNDIFD